jgi:hypothetical protein
MGGTVSSCDRTSTGTGSGGYAFAPMAGTGGTLHDQHTLLYRASKRHCDACSIRSKCCTTAAARKIPCDIHEDARKLARWKMKTKVFARWRDEITRREKARRDVVHASQDPPQLRTHEASCALRRGCGLPLSVSALLHRILGRAVNGDIDAAVNSKPEQQSLFQPGAPVRSAVGATQAIRRSLAQPTGLPRRRTRKRRRSGPIALSDGYRNRQPGVPLDSRAAPLGGLVPPSTVQPPHEAELYKYRHHQGGLVIV